MPRNTSVTLGDHFSSFVINKIAEGRFQSASEAVRAGLRLLEAEETRLEMLKAAVQEGVDSGVSERTPEEVRSDVGRKRSSSGSAAFSPH